MIYKRNVDVNVNVNLNGLDSGYECDIRTYTCMDVKSRQNTICPTAAFGRQGHKKHLPLIWSYVLSILFTTRSSEDYSEFFC